jgi:tetratricopeptide (TPR) repeat protein
MAEEKNNIALENYREDYKICKAYILLNEAEMLRAHGEYSKAIEKYEEVKNIKTECIRYVAHAELGIAETERLRSSGSLDDYDKILNKYENIGMYDTWYCAHTDWESFIFIINGREST